jgi:flagellar biosynthesis anti-sigma factor FlgM
MKITDNSLNPISPRKTEESRPVNNGSRVSSSGSVESKDKAELSSRARMLSKARVAYEEAPEVRNEKVDAIRSQISEGKYELNFSELAGKMFMPPQKK